MNSRKPPIKNRQTDDQIDRSVIRIMNSRRPPIKNRQTDDQIDRSIIRIMNSRKNHPSEAERQKRIKTARED